MKLKKIGLLIFLAAIIALTSSLAATRTFYVQETEFVKILPESIDPDNDNISYTFSQPLDEQGEWQTKYGDAGDYNLKISASDGVETTVEKVILVVEEKNKPPYLTETEISVKETQLIDLLTFLKDDDSPVIKSSFSPPFDKNGKWQTSYGDAGEFVTEIILSDEEFELKKLLKIKVLPTNKPPQIVNSFSKDNLRLINEDEVLKYFIVADDSNLDQLNYEWRLNNQTISKQSNGEFHFDYNSSGEYILQVEVKDSISSAVQEWKLEVKNINRPPKIPTIPIQVEEGDMISLDLPKKDEDGEIVTYTFKSPLDEQGAWLTGYADAGEYSLEVLAFDGQQESSGTIKITVQDIDQAPILSLPSTIFSWEGQPLVWKIETQDPDGDDLDLKIDNAPVGSFLDQKTNTFTWTPDYDFIQRRDSFITNVLSFVRLENYLLDYTTLPLKIEVCGAKLCRSQQVNLVVNNVNQEPVMEEIKPLIITEGQEIRLTPRASDLDGDYLKYSFSKPLNSKGFWTTQKGDRGTYTASITASDGWNSYTLPVEITVLKNNSAPTINIEDDKLTVNENQQFLIKVEASDPDQDPLELYLGSSPEGSSFTEGKFLWQPDFSQVPVKENKWWVNLVSKFTLFNKKFNPEKTTTWLSFTASDGEVEVVHPVEVTIKNVNRPPQIIDFLPAAVVNVKTNEAHTFHLAAKDDDHDHLEYTWMFNLQEPRVKGTDTVERTFLTPGKKKVKVIVSDGRDEIEKEWIVNVLSS
ncbi:MAG TPA: hypothetical protein VJC39_04730 [Candidatus Nanoarchaeia archaeon]|nr:hypothetical protein [Candidatus Nanoarchaeia archaeon]